MAEHPAVRQGQPAAASGARLRSASDRSSRSLAWPLALAGGLALLFFAQHQVATTPMTVASPLAAFARLGDLALVSLVLVLGYALGARLLGVLGLTITLAERVALATALGCGVMAYACFGLALVGLYRPPVLLALLIGMAVLLRRELLGLPAGLRHVGSELWRAASEAPRGTVALALLLALGVGAALLGALTPPHHFDALAYHLAAPQRFLLTGRIAPLPDVLFGNLPLTMEMLYGVGLAFGSDAFAQLLHLAFGGLTALALWSLARRHYDRPTAWLAVALFLATPLVTVWARVANIDLPLACFLLLAALAVIRAGEETGADARRWLVLAGIFAGLALGTKYQALFAVPILGLLVVVDGLRGRRGARDLLARAGLFWGLAVAVAAPWYLKNWIVLGNPIWPLFGGGRGFGPLAVELTDYFARGMTISPRTPLGYALLPLRAYTRGSIEAPLVILSPLYLLLPLLLCLPRRRAVLYPLAMSVGLAIGWALGFQELRYLLPICAPLSLAVAVVLRAALDRSRLRRLVLPALYLATLLSVGLTVLHVGADRPLAVSLGLESRDTYLQRNLATGPTYRATQFLAGRVQPGEVVRFFNDAQVYYVPYPTEPDHLDLALIALMEAHPAPDDALAALRAAGVDYLLVNEGNIRYRLRFDPDNRLRQARAAFAGLVPLLEPIYADGPEGKPSIVIYRIPPGSAAAGR